MPELNNSASVQTEHPFLSGNGEMANLTRLKDWKDTPLGDPAYWPQSLRTTLSIVLNSKFPMFLFWGSKLTCFYNDAFRLFLGVDGKHPGILGLDAATAWSEIWTIIKPLIDEVLQTGSVVWREDQLIPIFRNGHMEDVYWTFSYSPVTDETGKPGGVLVMCTETTQKIKGIQPGLLDKRLVDKEKQAQLDFVNLFNESEKKFRNTVMQAPVAIAVFRGPLFIIETANSLYLQVVGKAENELIGKQLFEVLPEVRQAVSSLMTDVLTTGISASLLEYSVPINRFGGIDDAYFNAIFEPLKEPDGTISGIIVVATEVTSLVTAKYKLRESEQHFRKLVMQSPIAVSIFRGPDFIIEIANTAMYENFWRKKEEDVVGKRLLDVFPELKDQKFPALLRSVFENGITHRENEAAAWLNWNEGTKKFYLDYEYAPLFQSDNTVSGVMVTLNDVTEKVETRKKLEEEEDRLRLATEGTKLATWDLNLQTGEIVHSPRLAEIFGHPASTILLHSQMRSQLHPDDLYAVVQPAFDEAVKTSIYNYEARIIWPDKTVHWIRTKGKVFYTEDGKPQRMIGTLLDFTEEKANQEEVARLAAVVQSSADAIISKKLDGTITSWNEAAEKMFGYKAAEMIGRSLNTIIPPDYLDEEAEILKKIGQGLGVYSLETRRIKKDHTPIDISLTISPIRDPHGNIIGASKIARDITKQKQIETKIVASEERFRLLANSMAQLIWTGDTEGNLNYFNQAVYEFSGMIFEELQTDGWLQMIHPDDRAENIRRWQHSIATGEDFIFEHRFKKYDGTFRWQLSRALPQKDSNGNIQIWVGTSTDIHEIKESEHQKDFFISMASHELKTPITSIKGYVQILMSMYRDKDDEFLNNSLKTVNKQILTLTTLIVDLLDLSKIKSGTLQLNMEHFCLNELITEIVKEIQVIEPGCVIHFSPEKNTGVYADRGRIGQVLINFLTNATKYSPTCKDIRVSTKITATELKVYVADSGIGISKTDQQKIFQRFYRVAGKDEKTFPGFGIGLFIAAEIIQRHQGKIGVESEPGKGSVFYFSLPLTLNNKTIN
ncbi:PAS domain S-box protein [Ferruginibacter paludis]|uniref:PAS domain S-box protein n=1 Tax=Ferruginibacter paludis TaxID=1310417 RepID=UPI0025B35670|nr:PAS domain S-box protein [Ferruginibacter paludis]MDN3654433.1 PAS domain S-box protein [Ferruginibacter paludis]